MATEASATEQAAEMVVEEIKATGNTIDIAEETSSQSKEFQAKNVEEKVKEVDLGIAEASATESKEMPETENSADVAEDVKKVEDDVQASNSEILGDTNEEKGENEKQESDTPDVEPAAEVQEKELKDQLDTTTAPNPQTEESEKSAEDPDTPSVKVSESEAAEEPAISAVYEEERVFEEEKPKESVVAEEQPNASEVAEEAAVTVLVSEEGKLSAVEKPMEEITVKSSVPETEEKAEPTIETELSVNDSGSAEISQVDSISNVEHEATPKSLEEESPVTDSSNVEEISDKLPEVLVSEKVDVIAVEAPPLNEPKEFADGTFTSQEDQNASESAGESLKEDNVGVTTDKSPVTEIVEGLTKSEDKVEDEMQEKTEVVATSAEVAQVEPVVAISESLDAATEVSVEKNESTEGYNTTSVETTGDLELKDSVVKKEDAEKAVEQNSAESAKDVEDIPREVPTKPSQRQSSNFFSKVKHSIVKVKKAIIGKSPSSKTMTAEGNKDIKVK